MPHPLLLGKIPRLEMINDFYKNFSRIFFNAEMINDFYNLEITNDFYNAEMINDFCVQE